MYYLPAGQPVPAWLYFIIGNYLFIRCFILSIEAHFLFKGFNIHLFYDNK